MEPVPLLAFEGITKRFGGTVAVDRVSVALHEREILALLGENGAGKSTLIKVLAGIHTPDEGRILFRGEPYRHLRATRGGRQAVAFIHQDLGLIPWMTVAENIALGVGYKRRFGLISWAGSRRQALAVLQTMSADINPDARVMHLTRTERSLVAIGRALAARAEVLVLDEPTASLPADEVERLLQVLRDLRHQNIGMIYVSHRLDEVFQVADRVAVLRDGRLVGSKRVGESSPSDLVTMIVGRPPDQVFKPPGQAAEASCLVLDGLVAREVGPVSLAVRRGERWWGWSGCAAPARTRSGGRCSAASGSARGTRASMIVPIARSALRRRWGPASGWLLATGWRKASACRSACARTCSSTRLRAGTGRSAFVPRRRRRPIVAVPAPG